MTRCHESVVVYHEELTFTTESVEEYRKFENWLSGELARLDARWASLASPHARRRSERETERRSHS